jgi:hypothetical protein
MNTRESLSALGLGIVIGGAAAVGVAAILVLAGRTNDFVGAALFTFIIWLVFLAYMLFIVVPRKHRGDGAGQEGQDRE